MWVIKHLPMCLGMCSVVVRVSDEVLLDGGVHCLGHCVCLMWPAKGGLWNQLCI